MNQTATATTTNFQQLSTYDQLLEEISVRFAALGDAPLFTTDTSQLWDAYLDSFPDHARQYHNCTACRHFIERFGGLVTIDDRGATRSAIWRVNGDFREYCPGIDRMRDLAERQKVTGVFLSSEAQLGLRSNRAGEDRSIVWTHFAVKLRKEQLYRGKLLSAAQAMAEKLEDHNNVMRALAEYSPEIVAKALAVLESNALYRAEKVIGPAKWLAELHAACKVGNRSNVVWRAIATAPAGFCHPRASMVGTLLDDLAAGLPGDDIARRFADKMNPLQYQRPQAAPTVGNIKQAEEIVAKLGIARALERRFARLEEVEAIWRPTTETIAPSTSVFGHLLKDKSDPVLVTAQQPITFAKFRRDILPKATALHLIVPMQGAFSAMVTAVHADVPPIIQWDTEDKRNPVSWYLWVGGSRASSWGLLCGSRVKITAVCDMPPVWGGNKAMAQECDRAFLILDGCREQRPSVGASLFPEILKSELHSVRATIEAFSKSAVLQGYAEATACGYIVGNRSPATVEVTDGSGIVTRYTIDRWE